MARPGPPTELAAPGGPQPPFPPTVTSARPSGPAPGPAPGWPAQPSSPAGTQPSPARRPARPRRGLAWAALAAVAAGAAVVTLILRWPVTAQPGHQTAAAQASHRAASSGPSTPAATSPPSPGWTAYTDPEGFRIGLPPGWALSTRSSSEVTFTGPDAGFVILVGWTTEPKPDALADWRNQAALKARSDPTYQQIAIRRVPYRGWNAADWEFTSMYKGQLTHVLDRGFIVTPGSLGYAIELYSPDAGWSLVRARLWAHLVRTFSPAG